MDELLKLIDTLLGENGCPWDKKQTHASLRSYIVEEANEAAEAIDAGDFNGLCEELGDVLFQVAFHAKLAERSQLFDMDDIIQGVMEKMVSRHSHIFGSDSAESAEEVERLWRANKIKEKERKTARAVE